jgi:UDP-2,4-diacetamido-2,4,6-trideoxy-beta-L-altropyranose hydrolase
MGRLGVRRENFQSALNMSEMKYIIFRVDSSRSLGAGHLMRCLTLAEAMKKLGVRSHFVYQTLPDHLGRLIKERGYSYTEISGSHFDPERDAQLTLDSVNAVGADWVIVDHYLIDARWESYIKGHVERVIVIDDLANRQHQCDFLIDQNPIQCEKQYDKLLPANAVQLLGTEYALIRPEFLEMRPESLQRRANSSLETLTISMGGIDNQNINLKVLEILQTTHHATDLQINLVLGFHSPWLGQIKNFLAQSSLHVELYSHVHDMASLLMRSDLALGAAGGSAWERCCLGVPSIIMAIAENQKSGAIALRSSGAATYISSISEIPAALSNFFKDESGHKLFKMSTAASQLIDGHGARRITERLFHGIG